MSSTSSVGSYVCLSAPADWDVSSAIKAFPHVSISNLQELRDLPTILQSCFPDKVTQENESLVISAAIARSPFNWNLKWQNTPCGFGVSLNCVLVYKSCFIISQSSRLKLDKHRQWTHTSQDLHVDIATVCFSREGQLFSLWVSLNKAECVFIWQRSSGAYEPSRQESVGSSHFSHALPSGSGYAEGPRLPPQHTVRILLFGKTVKSLWTIIFARIQRVAF